MSLQRLKLLQSAERFRCDAESEQGFCRSAFLCCCSSGLITTHGLFPAELVPGGSSSPPEAVLLPDAALGGVQRQTTVDRHAKVSCESLQRLAGEENACSGARLVQTLQSPGRIARATPARSRLLCKFEAYLASRALASPHRSLRLASDC